MKKLLIIFAVLCLAAPAMAADWNFYGSARMATFWNDVDPDTPGSDSDMDLQWALQGNARIGANVKVNDQIGGGFEYGSGPNLRKLFGTYTFGGGSQLLLGQTYTPTTQFYSNSVFDGDGDLLGVGQFYIGRVPMIQWKMGGFKVALVQPATQTYVQTAAVAPSVVAGVFVPGTAAVNYDTDVTIPKIELAYRFKTDMFFVDVFGGYQTYELDGSGVVGGQDFDIDAYVAGVGGGANFGAFFFNLGVHAGQNLGNYGAYNPLGLADEAVLNPAGTDTLDVDGLGYLAVIGFNASEMFTIEAGYGYEEAEVDDSQNTQSATQYYVNATINIAPGFFIVPEVGYIETENDITTATPNSTYFGAKWQINF